MRRRGTQAAAAALTGALVLPATAAAHGLGGRADLPIPRWLFGWAAAIVLILSFLALAALWTQPKLERPAWRPLPRAGRLIASRPVEIACGLIGVALLALTIWTGYAGHQTPTLNFAPTFVYVGFWVGLVPLSVLFGDVFRAFNPWRAIGRGAGWLARRVAARAAPPPLPYPERLGRWPAVAGIAAFAWLELAMPGGDRPATLAAAAVLYTALTLIAMTFFGAEAWIRRGEAFSVYFNLFARLSPFEVRDGRLGVRRPLAGATTLDAQPGTVALLAVMIGTVTFDGASEGSLWQGFAAPAVRDLTSAGLSPDTALAVVSSLGMLAGVLLVAGFYELAARGARAFAGSGGERMRSLAQAFAHSLVPIALVYVFAHYMTLLVFQGQGLIALASDPLGRGADLFGTAGTSVNYAVLGAEATWYLQVLLVVVGHVAAITLAHDRAIAVYGDAARAVRSQYPMLAVMVGFTTLALWLLSQANA